MLRAKRNVSERLRLPQHQLEVSSFHRNSEALFDRKETGKLDKTSLINTQNLLTKRFKDSVLHFVKMHFDIFSETDVAGPAL